MASPQEWHSGLRLKSWTSFTVELVWVGRSMNGWPGQPTACLHMTGREGLSVAVAVAVAIGLPRTAIDRRRPSHCTQPLVLVSGQALPSRQTSDRPRKGRPPHRRPSRARATPPGHGCSTGLALGRYRGTRAQPQRSYFWTLTAASAYCAASALRSMRSHHSHMSSEHTVDYQVFTSSAHSHQVTPSAITAVIPSDKAAE